MTARISEFDVLGPTAKWLVHQGCTDLMVSIARGQGRPLEEQEAELRESLKSEGFTNLKFASNGPDIIARDNARIWMVECKGLSGGDRTTVENNFDRALASVVSYYDEPNTEEVSDIKSIIRNLNKPDKPIRLVLALPRSDQYLKLVRKCVKPALRRKLDIWIILVDPEKKTVESCDPFYEVL